MSEKQRDDFLKNYVVDHLTVFLMEDFSISIDKALDVIYSSRLLDLLQDKDADFLSDSPSCIYESLKDEFAMLIR